MLSQAEEGPGLLSNWGQKFQGLYKHAQARLQGQPTEPPSAGQSLLHAVDEASTLSYKQRLTGFGVCCGLGLLFTLLSLLQ